LTVAAEEVVVEEVVVEAAAKSRSAPALNLYFRHQNKQRESWRTGAPPRRSDLVSF
jgi:hypothetical protein